jgi:hypothetical protein
LARFKALGDWRVDKALVPTGGESVDVDSGSMNKRLYTPNPRKEENAMRNFVHSPWRPLVATALWLWLAPVASAVDFFWVPVGDPGNICDS